LCYRDAIASLAVNAIADPSTHADAVANTSPVKDARTNAVAKRHADGDTDTSKLIADAE